MSGAFLITAPVAPIIGLLLSIAAYKESPVSIPYVTAFAGDFPLVAALVNLTLAWALLAWVYYALGCSNPDRANAGAFADLKDALVALRSELGALPPCPVTVRSDDRERPAESPVRMLPSGEPIASAGPTRCADLNTHAMLAEHERELRDALATAGPQWALGHGYVNLLRRAHRAEEALILVQDASVVIAGARYDLLRIAESTLANRNELQAGLECAATFLRNDSASYGRTSTQASSVVVSYSSTTTTEVTDPAPMPSLPTGTGMGTGQACTFSSLPTTPLEARTTLRDVRRAINDFRDGIQAGFVRARNHLMVVTVTTGFAVYALAWIAIIAGAEQVTVTNMAGYYLVGVVIGLFARLNMESQNDTAVDDFGLSATRLISAPIMSGVAAVGGVVLVTLISVIQGGLPVTSTTALAALLDLREHPLNLLVAGTFGLTPALLLDRLKQQADRYKDDLRSSEALQNTQTTSVPALNRG